MALCAHGLILLNSLKAHASSEPSPFAGPVASIDQEIRGVVDDGPELNISVVDGSPMMPGDMAILDAMGAEVAGSDYGFTYSWQSKDYVPFMIDDLVEVMGRIESARSKDDKDLAHHIDNYFKNCENLIKAHGLVGEPSEFGQDVDQFVELLLHMPGIPHEFCSKGLFRPVYDMMIGFKLVEAGIKKFKMSDEQRKLANVFRTRFESFPNVKINTQTSGLAGKFMATLPERMAKMKPEQKDQALEQLAVSVAGFESLLRSPFYPVVCKYWGALFPYTLFGQIEVCTLHFLSQLLTQNLRYKKTTQKGLLELTKLE